jgi:hypothetical protein
MPNYVELIYNPNKFFSDVKEENIGFLPPLSFVLASAFLSSASAAVFADVYARATIQLVTSQGLPADQAQMIYSLTYYSTIVAPFFVALVIWIIFSAVFHVISAILGGKGTFSTTLKFVGFCTLPNIVLFPLSFKIAMDTAAIIAVQGFEGFAHESIKIAGAGLGTISLGWQFMLWSFAIKHAREFEFGKAITTAAIPAVLYLVATWYSLISL